MKIKDEYVLQNIADRWVVVDTNARSVNFNKILSLNESGRFLWQMLENGAEVADLESALADHFGIGTERATEDVGAFTSELEKLGCIDEE